MEVFQSIATFKKEKCHYVKLSNRGSETIKDLRNIQIPKSMKAKLADLSINNNVKINELADEALASIDWENETPSFIDAIMKKRVDKARGIPRGSEKTEKLDVPREKLGKAQGSLEPEGNAPNLETYLEAPSSRSKTPKKV